MKDFEPKVQYLLEKTEVIWKCNDTTQDKKKYLHVILNEVYIW